MSETLQDLVTPQLTDILSTVLSCILWSTSTCVVHTRSIVVANSSVWCCPTHFQHCKEKTKMYVSTLKYTWPSITPATHTTHMFYKSFHCSQMNRSSIHQNRFHCLNNVLHLKQRGRMTQLNVLSLISRETVPLTAFTTAVVSLVTTRTDAVETSITPSSIVAGEPTTAVNWCGAISGRSGPIGSCITWGALTTH